MKNPRSLFLLLPLAFVGSALPAFSQGAFVTTVNSFIVSPAGTSQTQRRITDTTHDERAGFSLSTDSQRGSSRNTTTQGNQTTTEVYDYGETVTSQSSEQGSFTNTTTVDFSESFDYVDFIEVNTSTTGASGDRGPRYSNDKGRRRR